jgi:NAD(P)-dependent dehydrogenase (short-subunit alcohol dehydrogenase family)
VRQQYVAVTGASGALGRATTAALANRGYSVIGIDRGDAISDVEGLTLRIPNIDLTAADKAAEAFARIAEQFGSLHALVNIAGGFSWEEVEHGTANTWERLFRLNVITALNASKAALPLLLADGGAVVNVSAAASLKADAGMGAYTASKAGVSRLTESLAAELKDRGVRVNAVLPSIIDTPVNRADMPNAQFDKWVTPQALADVISFLITDGARAVTGVLLPVTGRT